MYVPNTPASPPTLKGWAQYAKGAVKTKEPFYPLNVQKARTGRMGRDEKGGLCRLTTQPASTVRDLGRANQLGNLPSCTLHGVVDYRDVKLPFGS